MKFHLIAQNILSGCVGAFLVMSMAHAQTPATVVPEISARRFNLIDDAGTVCGSWTADKQEVAFRMFHGNSKTSLVTDGEHAIFTVFFGPGTHTNSGALIASNTSSSMLLSDDEHHGSIGAYTGKDMQDVVIRGAAARMQLQDEAKQPRVVLGHGTVERPGDHGRKDLPLSSISLFDKNGLFVWGRF